MTLSNPFSMTVAEFKLMKRAYSVLVRSGIPAADACGILADAFERREQRRARHYERLTATPVRIG